MSALDDELEQVFGTVEPTVIPAHEPPRGRTKHAAPVTDSWSQASTRYGGSQADTPRESRGAIVPPRPPIVSGRQFLNEFKPIEPIVDGLPIGRGTVVSVTGATGSGKTTLCALLEVSLYSSRPFAGREVTGGSVLVLAGENPDDYAMHLAATLQEHGIDADDLLLCGAQGFLVMPGTFNVSYEVDDIHERVKALGIDLVAVFVDTSAAFYVEDDENNNVSMRRHASSMRSLTQLPGNPTVFVLCHPIKNAGKDNLTPRGGGAFLAEVDANLTVSKDDSGVVTLHWQGKIRGTPFDPIRFELVQTQLEGRVDARGRPIFSVAARHTPDERVEAIEAKSLDDENRLLIAMQRKPGASIADLAMASGFTTGPGSPQKSRVHRLLGILDKQGLAKKGRTGAWELTREGRKAADELH